jgi:glycosyltransferase involved in cell wall biosynthesis
MKSEPTISVIMPVYNVEKYLAEAVDSILSQSFDDFEFIIVDDGSSDNTFAMVKEYAAKDSRITAIKNEKNLGIVKSLNKALEIAKGRYIARMDGDDICLPDRFKVQVEYLDNHSDIALVYSDPIFIDENSRIMCRPFRPPFDLVIRLIEPHRCNFVPHDSVMFRRSILSVLGGYNETYKGAEDADMWVRMRESGFLFGYTKQVFIKVRLRFNNTSFLVRYRKLHGIYPIICFVTSNFWCLRTIIFVRSFLRSLYLRCKFRLINSEKL